MANLEMHLVVVVPSSSYSGEFGDDGHSEAAEVFALELGEMLAHIPGATVGLQDYLVEE